MSWLTLHRGLAAHKPVVGEKGDPPARGHRSPPLAGPSPPLLPDLPSPSLPAQGGEGHKERCAGTRHPCCPIYPRAPTCPRGRRGQGATPQPVRRSTDDPTARRDAPRTPCASGPHTSTPPPLQGRKAAARRHHRRWPDFGGGGAGHWRQSQLRQCHRFGTASWSIKKSTANDEQSRDGRRCRP